MWNGYLSRIGRYIEFKALDFYRGMLEKEKRRLEEHNHTQFNSPMYRELMRHYNYVSRKLGKKKSQLLLFMLLAFIFPQTGVQNLVIEYLKLKTNTFAA